MAHHILIFIKKLDFLSLDAKLITMNKVHREITEQIFKITNKLLFLEKRSILKHKDIKLYPSEIHLLNVISEDLNINAKDMAIKLGVTKGAVSQTLTRLENKGVLYKTRDPMLKNELTVHFTNLGQEILDLHKQFKNALEKHFLSCLSEFSADQKKTIKLFLKRIMDIL